MELFHRKNENMRIWYRNPSNIQNLKRENTIVLILTINSISIILCIVLNWNAHCSLKFKPETREFKSKQLSWNQINLPGYYCIVKLLFNMFNEFSSMKAALDKNKICRTNETRASKIFMLGVWGVRGKIGNRRFISRGCYLEKRHPCLESQKCASL